ncbi:hypothetical protein HDU97_006571 [Phlyctochytrium planicorne]|nr:hypothetical protein HDU97_006571 [Phlyctochytrium planicorne]
MAPPMPSSPSSGRHAGSSLPSPDTASRRSSIMKGTLRRKLVRGESTASDLLKQMQGLKAVASENKESFTATNESQTSFHTVVAVRGSVIPNIVLPGLFLTVWATIWTVVFTQTEWKVWSTQPLLISIISVVLGLLLVFRTNTAYDRYWEGRKLWASITTACRNLARVVWISTNCKTEEQRRQRRGVLNLVLAYPIAVKHEVRGELGTQQADLAHLLIHVPSLDPMVHPDLSYIPLEISFSIASWIAKARLEEVIDMQTQVSATASLSQLVDCHTAIQRIAGTPIPMAYNIHLKQVVWIYLLSLPFQLVSALSWATIPVVSIASFTYFGIESIAGQIENPFGYDANDLALDTFITQIREEILELTSHQYVKDPDTWINPLINPDSSSTMGRSKRSSYHSSIHRL